MALLTRNGKRFAISFFPFLPLFAFLSSLGAQTTPICTTSSTNQVVHAEGLAEPIGSLLLNCAGGTPGQMLSGNLTATFAAPVTNRLSSATTPDISLSVDTGSGPVTSNARPTLVLPNVLEIDGIGVTVPDSRTFVVKLNNVRLAVALLTPGQPVSASFSSGFLSVTSASAVVATPIVGLLAGGAVSGITCAGSPLPASLAVPDFFAAGTRFSTLRVTEGFGNAFVTKDPTSDAGTRILISYANFPAGARVFVPDFIAGNSAAQPTAAGDLGGTQSPGAYAPTATGTLLLARVTGQDSTGAGGAPMATAAAFSALTSLGAASEVPLTAGAGMAVYEVIDAGAATLESAQIPTFLGLDSALGLPVTTATVAVTLAPVSTVSSATATDPVPRFRLSVPPNDCSLLADCAAPYFPSLSVGSPAEITFRSPANGLQQTDFIQIGNTGGGTLSYAATVTYQSGNGFVFIDPVSAQGTNSGTVRVITNAAGLTPGTYRATVLISAGAAGSRTIPITLTVETAAVSITSVTNAATFATGPLVAGSLATVKGAGFNGTAVTVWLDGLPATVLFRNAGQINFQVPAGLTGKSTVQLVVTVDSISSAPQAVSLAAAAPGIFGVLNQNGAVNTSATPAAPSSVVQVFATGVGLTSFRVVAVLADRDNLNPLFAGDAPGLAGVQQINFTVPADIAPGALPLQVCSTNLVLRACSPPIVLTVR